MTALLDFPIDTTSSTYKNKTKKKQHQYAE